jgi:fucose 4-O-acetylase-like acetyltransferase
LLLLIIPGYITDAGNNFISFLLSGFTGLIILFTFFRKNDSLFTKDRRLGKVLQFIGRRTLDIYLLHYFILPYHMNRIGTWLLQYTNKSVDLLIILILALWIIGLSLLLSEIIRLSPFLAHYLFGAKTKRYF